MILLFLTSNIDLIDATLFLVRRLIMSNFYVFVLCMYVCVFYDLIFICNVNLYGYFLRKHVRLSYVFYSKRLQKTSLSVRSFFSNLSLEPTDRELELLHVST